MKAVKTEFPNPVLASNRDDYTPECAFYTTFDPAEITVTAEDIVIPVKYTLVCKGLQQLVEENLAVAVISIKSSAASYSRLFRFENGKTEMEVKVPKFGVVKRFEIAGSVIAQKPIPGFTCGSEFNELYFANSTFDIRKGDVLAREDSRVIYVDDSELEKPLTSIFNINNGHDQADHVVATFDDEKIEINLCEPLYKLYTDFIEFNNGALRRYVTGIIVYPVLVDAVAKICEAYQQENGTILDRRWCRAIEHKAEKKSINLQTYDDSYATVADALLGGVSLDALTRLKDILESELNSGDAQMLGGRD